MSWQLVEGVPLPDPVGGHPALDFCNTRAGWGTADPKEYLTSAARARGCGPGRPACCAPPTSTPLLATTAGRPAQAAALLRRRRPARGALRVRPAPRHRGRLVARGPRGGGSTGGLALAAACRRRPRGVAARRRRRAPRGHRARRAPWTCPSLAVAAAAEDLLTSPLGTCVAACPGVGCGWLFADPRRRRRWCSMAVCGNRAKARATPSAGGPDRRRPTGASRHKCDKRLDRCCNETCWSAIRNIRRRPLSGDPIVTMW